MEITLLVWNLFIIMMPGIIATLFLRVISTSRKYSPFDFTIYSAIFGISSYLLLEVIYSLISCFRGLYLPIGYNLSVWKNLFNISDTSFEPSEMIYSYLISIPLGILIGLCIKKGWCLWLFRKLHITNRYGDEDIWTYYLCYSSTEWVCLRDFDKDLIYDGYVIAYSDSAEKREILLGNVIVYKDVASEKEVKELYSIDKLYIDLDNKNYSIETRKNVENGKENFNN